MTLSTDSVKTALHISMIDSGSEKVRGTANEQAPTYFKQTYSVLLGCLIVSSIKTSALTYLDYIFDKRFLPCKDFDPEVWMLDHSREQKVALLKS